MSEYLRPLPLITDAEQPFWDGIKLREFRVPRCTDCGDYNWPPFPACRSCLSEQQTWIPVSGNGTVFSYTIVHRGPGAWADEVPYVVALVELAESPRPLLVLANVTDVNINDVHIGMPVQFAYHDIEGEDVTMYRAVPAA